MTNRTWNYDMRNAPRGVRLMLLLNDGEVRYSPLTHELAQQVKAWTSVTTTVAAKREPDCTEWLERIETRLARMEARECQLMYHMGLDPKVRKYDSPNKHTEAIGKCPQGNESFEPD